MGRVINYFVLYMICCFFFLLLLRLSLSFSTIWLWCTCLSFLFIKLCGYVGLCLSSQLGSFHPLFLWIFSHVTFSSPPLSTSGFPLCVCCYIQWCPRDISDSFSFICFSRFSEWTLLVDLPSSSLIHSCAISNLLMNSSK